MKEKKKAEKEDQEKNDLEFLQASIYLSQEKELCAHNILDSSCLQLIVHWQLPYHCLSKLRIKV